MMMAEQQHEEHGVPSTSPVTNGGRMGRTRRLRAKVLEEFRNVTRKHNERERPSLDAASSTMVPAPLRVSISPPPLPSAPNEDGSDHEDQHTPGPVPHKTRGCGICERSFTVFRPKHTCKLCTQRICDDCSKNRVKLNVRLERKRGSRICDPCARNYLLQHGGTSLSPVNHRSPPESPTQPEAPAPSSSSKPPLSTSDVVQPLAKQHEPEQKVEDTTMIHSSHLRARHYLSFVVILVLLLARIVVCDAVRPLVALSGVETVSLLVAPLVLVARALEAMVTLRLIGSYVLGLILFDEFLRSNGPKPNPRKRVELHRRRTGSSVSETLAPVAISRSTSVPAVREEDEVLEVDTGDQLLEEDDGFQFPKLVSALEQCVLLNRTADDEHAIRVGAFLTACEFICGFIMIFGRATSFAASTVTGYMGTIRSNVASWPEPHDHLSWKDKSVAAMIQQEVDLDIAASGGKKKPSCSRCVLRLVWFIEFVEASIRYTVIDSRDDNCVTGASRAYEETIGARHPWIIRKGVLSALSSIPPRSSILNSLHLEDDEEAVEKLRRVQHQMRTIIDEVHGILEQHQLLDLK